MSVIVEVRNPEDLIDTYDQIEIQRNTSNSATGMADIKTDLEISSTYASDLGTGYTPYTDADGVVGTHWYRWRYKNSVSGAVSNYSDIFPAGGSILQSRFRRKMRDTNSNDYFFKADEIEDFEEDSVKDLWPITWFEIYLDNMIVPDGSTEIFAFSTGVTRVNSIEIVSSDGQTQGEISGWKVRGRYVIFATAPSSGNTIRVWVEKKFTKPAEVPKGWDSLIINRMRLQAFETLEADRSKFYKYNSIAKPEGGSLPSLDRIITRIEAQIMKRESQIRRVRKPADINLTGK